jgi:hypothetical protein
MEESWRWQDTTMMARWSLETGDGDDDEMMTSIWKNHGDGDEDDGKVVL